MALSNYGELKTTVANTIGRSDLTTPIIDFITLAHADIMQDMRGDIRLQKRNASFSITGEYVAAPSDFLELVSMHLNTTPKKPIEYLPHYFQAAQDTTGVPAYVTIVGNTTAGTEDFRFWPIPSSTQTATIEYYASITYFANDAATNWILTRYPGLYLYRALHHAAIYAKDAEGAAGYASVYADHLARAKNAGGRTRYGVNGMTVRTA